MSDVDTGSERGSGSSAGHLIKIVITLIEQELKVQDFKR